MDDSDGGGEMDGVGIDAYVDKPGNINPLDY